MCSPCSRTRMAGRCCSAPGWRRPPPSSAPSIRAITWWRRRVMYWALAPLARRRSHALGAAHPISSRPTIRMPCARRSFPGRRSWSGLESPANPLWSITDIAQAGNGSPMMPGPGSPSIRPAPRRWHTRPLTLGADIVMHAATKILNGHSDVVAGALAFATQDAFSDRIAGIRKSEGAILGPFGGLSADSRACAPCICGPSGRRRVRWRWPRACRRNPDVAQVLYPGLPGHPGHAHRRATDGETASASCSRSACVAGRGRDRDGGAGAAVEARHLARRGRGA